MPHGHPHPIPPRHDLPRPVLTIADAQSEAMTVATLCQAVGVNALRTTSVTKAGAIPTRMHSSAIITDLSMPGADGLDGLFMIAEQASGVPVMVVTAAERLLLKAAGEVGGSYGLSKLVRRDFIVRAGIPPKPARTRLH